MKTASPLVPLLVCAVLAACAGNPEKSERLDYAKAVTLPPLEVPPPLVAPAEGSEAVGVPVTPAAKPDQLLPEPANAQIERAGDMRWLVLQAKPEQLWESLKLFWRKEGFELVIENATTGILETQWAENRADIPESFIRGLISKVAPKVYSAPTRDKYRLRLERGRQEGTSEVFLTHYGVEQVERNDSVGWQPRPSDPERAAEMLARLMIYVGVPTERAQVAVAASAPAARARLDGQAIVVDEGFARAWRRVGIALDRVGFVVEDVDRSRGLYFVRLTEEGDKPGWFARLFGSDEKITIRNFRVKLAGDDVSSRVSLESEQDAPVPPALGQEVLKRLEENLRR